MRFSQTVEEPEADLDECDGERNVGEDAEPVRDGSQSQEGLSWIGDTDSLVKEAEVVKDLVEGESGVDGGEDEEPDIAALVDCSLSLSLRGTDNKVGSPLTKPTSPTRALSKLQLYGPGLSPDATTVG